MRVSKSRECSGCREKKIQLLTAENQRVSGWGAGSARELSKCPDSHIYFYFLALLCCVLVGELAPCRRDVF